MDEQNNAPVVDETPTPEEEVAIPEEEVEVPAEAPMAEVEVAPEAIVEKQAVPMVDFGKDADPAVDLTNR